MGNGEFVVAAFRSRQQVMQFIRLMEERGAKARIINTPHEILIGCGLSAAFDREYAGMAKSIVEAVRPPAFVGFYMAQYLGARLVIKPYIKINA